MLVRRLRERDPMPRGSALALITWSGMRGGVSLAAALAIPLATDAGEPFPGRSLILFLTFAVIFGTLVVQGLTLPLVIRLLHLEDDGEDYARDEARARIHAASSALLRLEELADEDWVRPDTAERVRASYGFRRDPLLGAARRRGRRLDRGPLARLPATEARAAERRARGGPGAAPERRDLRGSGAARHPRPRSRGRAARDLGLGPPFRRRIGSAERRHRCASGSRFWCSTSSGS